MYTSLWRCLHLTQTIRLWLIDAESNYIQSIKVIVIAWNTNLQLSDASHEMRQKQDFNLLAPLLLYVNYISVFRSDWRYTKICFPAGKGILPPEVDYFSRRRSKQFLLSNQILMPPKRRPGRLNGEAQLSCLEEDLNYGTRVLSLMLKTIKSKVGGNSCRDSYWIREILIEMTLLVPMGN